MFFANVPTTDGNTVVSSGAAPPVTLPLGSGAITYAALDAAGL